MTPKPYIGLFGSHSGDWRARCAAFMDERGIAWFDPTDPAWADINAENGDEKQALIDDLVARQHRGILGAACVVYHLAARNQTGEPIAAFAARCELGFLTGRGTPTFAHIEPDVVGRNYLWAQMKPYPHMTRCHSLDEALAQAAAFVKGLGQDGD